MTKVNLDPFSFYRACVQPRHLLIKPSIAQPNDDKPVFLSLSSPNSIIQSLIVNELNRFLLAALCKEAFTVNRGFCLVLLRELSGTDG